MTYSTVKELDDSFSIISLICILLSIFAIVACLMLDCGGSTGTTKRTFVEIVQYTDSGEIMNYWTSNSLWYTDSGYKFIDSKTGDKVFVSGNLEIVIDNY